MKQILVPKEEARVAIGYGRRSFDYLLKSGDLPFVRHGARVFIAAEKLETFALQDRVRMVPKAARNPSESTVTSPAVHNEEPQPTYQPTHPDSAEREKQLRRRRNSDGGQSS